MATVRRTSLWYGCLLNIRFGLHGNALLRWAEQGLQRRVVRGAYVALSSNTMVSVCVLDFPWVLVPELFAPAYIGAAQQRSPGT